MRGWNIGEILKKLFLLIYIYEQYLTIIISFSLDLKKLDRIINLNQHADITV